MGDPMDPGASRQPGLAGAGSVQTDYFDDADSYMLPRKHAHQSTVIKIFISYGEHTAARVCLWLSFRVRYLAVRATVCNEGPPPPVMVGGALGLTAT